VLPDLKSTFSQVFTLNGVSGSNMYPYFATSLIDQTVPLMSIVPYSLPSISDPNAGDTGSVQSVIDVATNALPPFVTLTGTPALQIVNIAPNLIGHVGTYNMKVVITDTTDIVPYTFKIIVTNLAPKVTSTIPTDVTVKFGTS